MTAHSNETYPLESLDVPTLVIHARNDPWGSFVRARSIAVRIPGARFEAVSSGGHLLLGNRESVRTLMVDFIRRHQEYRHHAA